MLTIRWSVSAAAAAAALTCALVAAPANASGAALHKSAINAQSRSAQRPAGTKYAAMTVHGIDARVARAHGYRVVTLADGTMASVKKSELDALGANPSDAAITRVASTTYNARTGAAGGTSSQTLARQRADLGRGRYGVAPDNYVWGNCGDSYYFLSAWGADWSALTGFDVRAATVSSTWSTDFRNPSDSVIEGHNWENGPTGPSWEGSDGTPPYLTLDDTAYGVVWHGTWSGFVTSGEATLVDGTTCFSGDPGDTSAN